MFKVGDKVVCLLTHKYHPQINKGNEFIIKGIRYNKIRNQIMCSVDEYRNVYFDEELFEHSEIYYRKQKLQRICSKLEIK
jgi:hypothetical protein